MVKYWHQTFVGNYRTVLKICCMNLPVMNIIVSVVGMCLVISKFIFLGQLFSLLSSCSIRVV